jgi:OOP family OmpA-OmpF porin
MNSSGFLCAKNRWQFLFLAVFALAWSFSLKAQAGFDWVDKAGAKDYPLVGRFQGSIILNYGTINFESVKVPVSATKKEVFEGKLHNYLYYAPKNRSPLEIFRSYKAELEKSRFKILFSCDDAPVCYKQDLDEHASFWTDKPETFEGGFKATSRMGSSGNYPPRFLVARLTRAEGDIIAVLTVKGPSSTEIDRGAGGPYFLQIIETQAMQTGSVVINDTAVDAEGLKRSLAADGKISLYSIFFDTGKFEMKDESKPQLGEMAKLLNENKQLKVLVVGHTDNQGDFNANLNLSQKRAEAIVNALVKDYKIDVKRLTARGAANIAPVASNGTENGRSKNRRVELVEQ